MSADTYQLPIYIPGDGCSGEQVADLKVRVSECSGHDLLVAQLEVYLGNDL